MANVDDQIRCIDCFYFEPNGRKPGTGWCFHEDLHVEFTIEEIEVGCDLIPLLLREGDGEDAHAYMDVKETDFCSKAEGRS